MIQTKRLILRRWKATDFEPFYEINKDPLVIEFLPKAKTRIESNHLINKIEENFEIDGFGLWAVEVKDSKKFIGFTGLMRPSFKASFTPCVEVGWRLSSQHWGFGYATEAAQKVLEVGFNEYKLEEILSFTVPENVRSRRVMEKIGMSHNPKENFFHPKLSLSDRLSLHVLYRIKNTL